MTSEPLVSVVIPTRDRPELLELAIQSVLRQTVRDFEVLVVNDGGPVGAWEESDERVRLISRSEQGGAAAARNSGIAAARGRYLTFLDDDDEFTPDRLEIGLAGIDHAPISLCWKAGLQGDVRWNRNLSGMVGGVLLEGPVPQLGSAVVRRDLALPLDESLHVSEDVEWWLRMSQVAPVYTVPAVGYLIRDHVGQRLTNFTEQRLEARLQILEQHSCYFERYPRAAAYHWLRAGGLAATVGDRHRALACFWRAWRARPSSKLLVHLAGACFALLAQAVRSGP